MLNLTTTTIDYVGINFAILISFIIIYAICSSAINYYKIKFIHESGIAILLGILLSYIVYHMTGNFDFKFQQHYFFYIFLPPIVFAESFNMTKRKIS